LLAIRADRAAVEFRGMPPSAVDEIKKALGKLVVVESSDWNVGSSFTPNRRKSPSTTCG
jgi:peptide/nickel transport system substrate-binding protein